MISLASFQILKFHQFENYFSLTFSQLRLKFNQKAIFSQAEHSNKIHEGSKLLINFFLKGYSILEDEKS